MRRSRGSAWRGRTSRGRRRSAWRKSARARPEMLKPLAALAALFISAAAHAYLPPKGVEFELVEFPAQGKTLQGGLFAPDAKRFAKPRVGVVLVHGVESYWYQGPPMFLAGLLAAQGYAALAYNGAHSGESFRTSEFETAVREVGAAIAYLKDRGYRDII